MIPFPVAPTVQASLIQRPLRHNAFMQTLITHARLVNEGQIVAADLRIKNGRIDQIASTIRPMAGERVIDANNGYVLPGMIDDQVHFREPGLTHKGDIASESAAAVAGGITSFMDMPNTQPPTLDAAALEAKYAAAQGRSWGNYGFYLGASQTNLAAIQRLDPRSSPGVKVFMGASTGEMLVDDPRALEAIFQSAPTPIITHCEDTPTILANMAAFKAAHGNALTPEMHPDIRSRQACYQSTQRAIQLARRYDARLHVLHLSTADELALFDSKPLLDANGKVQKRITAETCIHFLHFAREDYARLGNRIKCNPAIKDDRDRQALRQALLSDTIDVLATDHAPHTWEEKNGDYFHAAAGLPLVQDALLIALNLVHHNAFTLTTIVTKFAHAPARLFDLHERGFLREGYWADLVLVDAAPTHMTPQRVLSKCGWTPFEGVTVHARIAATWVNGQQVWDGKTLCGPPPGHRLQFAR